MPSGAQGGRTSQILRVDAVPLHKAGNALPAPFGGAAIRSGLGQAKSRLRERWSHALGVVSARVLVLGRGGRRALNPEAG